MGRAERSEKRYVKYYQDFLAEGAEEQEAEIAAMRLMCQTDLYWLATKFYLMDQAAYRGRKRWYEPIHGRMCDFFERDEDTMIVVFRGAMKTTLAKIWAIQKLLQNPDVRIGFWSKTSALAEATLESIKEMAQNDDLMALFPDVLRPRHKRKKGGWEKDNANQMTIMRSEAMRAVAPNESQIEAWGTTSSVTGRHYDYQYYDDPIDKDNVSTPSMVQKMRDWWGAVQAIKEPGAIQKYTGTPWHSMDLTGTVRSLFKQKNTMWQPAANTDLTHINYPFFTKKFLGEQKDAMGAYLFSAQYLLDTRPKEDRIFVGHEIYKDEDFPEDPKYYISVDPSTGFGEDKTGLCVAAVSKSMPNRIYFVEAEGYMVQPDEFCDLLVQKIKKYRPVRVGVEWGHQIGLKSLLVLKLREERIHIPDLKELSTGGGPTAEKKSVKIARTIGAFTRDARAVFKPDMYALFDQMELYNPHVAKNEDDIIDAAGMMVRTIEHFAPGRWIEGSVAGPDKIVLGALPVDYFLKDHRKPKTLKQKLLIA